MCYPVRCYFVISLLFLSDIVVNAKAADYINNIGMEFVEIPEGCFLMGRNKETELGGNDELPRHQVCFEQSFYIGKYEVTQAQWESVMGDDLYDLMGNINLAVFIQANKHGPDGKNYNPSEFPGPMNPVDNVSWHDVQFFIERLNAKDPDNRYRLPSETEWEYAARGGTETPYFFGETPAGLNEYAWFAQEARARHQPVGQKKPNPFGLYDMFGNVWEWVEDCYHLSYEGSPANGQPWTSECYQPPACMLPRVVRGSAWNFFAHYYRSANRHNYPADTRKNNIGFRLIRLPR